MPSGTLETARFETTVFDNSSHGGYLTYIQDTARILAARMDEYARQANKRTRNVEVVEEHIEQLHHSEAPTDVTPIDTRWLGITIPQEIQVERKKVKTIDLLNANTPGRFVRRGRVRNSEEAEMHDRHNINGTLSAVRLNGISPTELGRTASLVTLDYTLSRAHTVLFNLTDGMVHNSDYKFYVNESFEEGYWNRYFLGNDDAYGLWELPAVARSIRQPLDQTLVDIHGPRADIATAGVLWNAITQANFIDPAKARKEGSNRDLKKPVIGALLGNDFEGALGGIVNLAAEKPYAFGQVSRRRLAHQFHLPHLASAA